MRQCDTVVAVAGWEERFCAGLALDLESSRPRDLLVFAFEEFFEQTSRTRKAALEAAEKSGARYREVTLRREPIALWGAVRDTFARREWSQRSVLVDISTMPRELIWLTFSFLQSALAEVSYVYHKAGEYSNDWITRDTDQPRLVYQQSGISEFGRPTCLLLLSGFDTARAAQLIQFYDPGLVLVGIQTGEQYGNQQKNVERNTRLFEGLGNTNFFSLDAFSQDHGLGAIEAALGDVLRHYNVVAASLGPKPSAVALYRLNREHPEIALAYAPSREFSMEYSKGIGPAVNGVL
jgi:hypothetical protein